MPQADVPAKLEKVDDDESAPAAGTAETPPEAKEEAGFVPAAPKPIKNDEEKPFKPDVPAIEYKKVKTPE